MTAAKRQARRRVKRREYRGRRITEADLLAAGLVKSAGEARGRLRSRRVDPVVPVTQEIAVLGFALDYAGLVELLIRRRQSLGLSQADVDAMAGWTDSYTSKLEMRTGLPIWLRREQWIRPQAADELVSRTAGALSMKLWLQTLGVKLALTVESENAG